MENSTPKQNPLQTLPEKELLRSFAVPSIIAMLVSSLYNIVDQFFIGHSVGELGNAATNIVFPLSISCVAIALLFGIGGASTFNLSLGSGNTKKAGNYIGNATVMMLLLGLLLTIVTLLFTQPLLLFFGSPQNVLPYASVYARITALGFPFLILSAGGGHLVRADGSPKFTMAINLSGAIINTVLDALFVFGFHWGMAGAAAATVIGQVFSCGMVFWYLSHYKTVSLGKEQFRLHREDVSYILSLGTAPCFNQISMMIVQIVLNKSLKYYGGHSVYGEAIPIACAGIIIKVSQIVMSFIIGISQGLQPIVSFNYGAKNYARVKRSYLLAIKSGSVIGIIAFILFQCFPRAIISIFGTGSEAYYQFAESYFRIFLMFILFCFVQPITSNFFTAIGKPYKGVFLSLTRQIIFLLPLLVILPLFFGINGILFAQPIADFIAIVVCTIMIYRELHRPEFVAA